jgi:integrase
MGRRKNSGLVSIDNDKGKIRLRWRYNSKRCSLNLSWPYKRRSLTDAKKIAECIEDDIRYNRFDASLLKYKNFKGNTATNSEDEKANVERHSREASKDFPIPLHKGKEDDQVLKLPKELILKFEHWVKVYRDNDCSEQVHYRLIKNMLTRWGNFKEEEIILKFRAEKLAASTFNERLSILRKFFDWMVKKKHLSENPLEDVIRKKSTKKSDATRSPFTLAESRRILHAFKTDQFVHPCSRYKHSNYYSFVYFLFSTGVRNAEAVGLRVENVDVSNNRIKIERALARTLKGTHPKARIDKETKNGKVRYLPLSPELKEVILPLLINKQPKDLVFSSVNGLCIDDRMFLRRVFKPILRALNIECRTLYACRHGFSSRLLAAGISPVTAAFLLGNNPETALRYYTHLMNVPETLPAIL